MKLRITLSVMLVTSMLFLPALARAQTDAETCNLIGLFGAWARAVPEGSPTGAVFGFLVNLGNEQDTLLSASADVSEAVELHETTIDDNDVMHMNKVEQGFVVEPKQFLQLQPGGLHIMLINLQQPLRAGSFELRLNFERAGEVVVTVPVVDQSETNENAEAAISTITSPELSETCAAIHVFGAWARPTVAAMPNSAAYTLLLNLTDKDEVLISAATDVATVVELHEMTMGEGDVMQMQPVAGGIAIPAGGVALLQPGGLHIMLIGLNQQLREGETLDLRLNFDANNPIDLTVPIREPPPDTTMGNMDG